MNLELKIVHSVNGYDIQIRNPKNKSPGISVWKLSNDGAESLAKELMRIGSLIYRQINFREDTK